MKASYRVRRRVSDLNWFLRDRVPGYRRANYWYRTTTYRLVESTIGRNAFGVTRWNTDKPHRCPACHAVAVDDRRPVWRETYDCCRCGTRFARWPVLTPLLPDRGVVCTEHRTLNEEHAS